MAEVRNYCSGVRTAIPRLGRQEHATRLRHWEGDTYSEEFAKAYLVTWLAFGAWAAVGALIAVPAAIYYEQWRDRILLRLAARWAAVLVLLAPLGFEIAIGVPPLIAATAIVPAIVFFAVRGIISAARRA